MINYIIKRLLLMVPTLLGISIVVFVVVRLAPGDPTTLRFRGEGGVVHVDPALVEMQARFWDRNVPMYVQYWQWINKIVRLDLGDSITEKRPVTKMIGERIGLTIKLNVVSYVLAYFLAIPLGLLAAQNRFAGPIRRHVFDTASGVLLLIMYSLPVIFVGTGLILLVTKGGVLEDFLRQRGWTWLEWIIMPTGGVTSPQSSRLGFAEYLLDAGRHFVLPVITMTVGGLAFMSKLARNSLLENLQQDYVRTAYAKGLRERTVVYVHALRNSLLPMITIMVGILPGLIGGTVIIEHMFNLPGMGQLFFQAATKRDYTMIQAITLIGAALTLLAILIGDILYALVDPRVRYD